MPLFVHFVQTVQAPSALGRRSKNDASKIVQICALFCNIKGLMLYQQSKSAVNNDYLTFSTL
jgi:hypothetical protein